MESSSPPSEQLFPVAVLLDELKHDDITLRLAAIRRLSTIALALGAERTRQELIPFLEESLEDEDEVLTVLAEELGNFVPYIGGPQYADFLISPLESFAGVEETLVRDKATASLNRICDQMTPEQVESSFMPLVQRLTNAEWFTNRVSVAAIYAYVYARVSDKSKTLLRHLYKQLVLDDGPMVRRAAATNLKTFIPHIAREHVVEDIIPLFVNLMKDDQDSVRLLTVDVFVAIAEVLGPDETRAQLLGRVKELFADKSWRVRYMVADRFEKVALAVGPDAATLKDDLVPAFVKLLKDTEAEVRTVIVKQIPGFCKLVDRETVLAEIMPSVDDLVNDQSQHVRAALATDISGLAPILGKDLTIKFLLPMFLQMLKDEFPEVRLNIICKLELVNDVIGIDLLSQSLLPAIEQLAEDKQWRVRLAIIEYIPMLASQLGVKFFDTQLRDLCMRWLWDSVFSIRAAATENLKNLTEVFGVEWSKETIIPKIVEAGSNQNYLYRMTSCSAATSLAPVVSYDVIKDDILPFLNSMVGDSIPNIRFNIARSYEIVVRLLREKAVGGDKAGAPAKPDAEPEAMIQDTAKDLTPEEAARLDAANDVIRTLVVPNLEKLKDDADVDVRYFAGKSLLVVG
ncbi:armadillo-type protein [Dipodascopsis tothii]|uniref:armadillo-type protein n=1 Tax=Dipodascopsis tothii TaxID=44089 RepID=UPI0034CDEAD3